MLVPRQPLSTLTSYNNQQFTQINLNLNPHANWHAGALSINSPVCRKLHVSSQLQQKRRNLKDRKKDPFLIMRENKNLNLGINPTLHQQTVTIYLCFIG